MRKALVALVFLSFAVAAFASSAVLLTTVQNAMSALCTQVKSLLPVAAMLMLVIGGVIYAAGQMLGAETRARANVWATACLTGALIAILMVVVAQPVLQMVYGDQGTIGCDITQ